MGFKTNGYGGKTMVKTVRVQSDDPARRKFTVTVKGPVEKVVDISPPSVFMEGRPGDVLEKVVTITPSPGYPFSVLDVKKVNNSPIQVELIPTEADANVSKLRIKATSEQAKSLYDVVQVKTDSKLKPLLTIRTYMVFVAPPPKQPEHLKSLKIK